MNNKTVLWAGAAGLAIPSVPSVANVSESVTVEIDFVATGVQNDGNG